MKQFNKKVIGGAVGVSMIGAFDSAVDSADMGAMGSATKTTAKVGLFNKISKGWL